MTKVLSSIRWNLICQICFRMCYRNETIHKHIHSILYFPLKKPLQSPLVIFYMERAWFSFYHQLVREHRKIETHWKRHLVRHYKCFWIKIHLFSTFIGKSIPFVSAAVDTPNISNIHIVSASFEKNDVFLCNRSFILLTHIYIRIRLLYDGCLKWT